MGSLLLWEKMLHSKVVPSEEAEGCLQDLKEFTTSSLKLEDPFLGGLVDGVVEGDQKVKFPFQKIHEWGRLNTDIAEKLCDSHQTWSDKKLSWNCSKGLICIVVMAFEQSWANQRALADKLQIRTYGWSLGGTAMHLSSHTRLMALLALLDPTTMGSLHHTSLTSTAILTICHQHSLDVDGFHATAHCAFTKAAVISAAEVEFDAIIVNLSA
jgi:hypothetical protein